MDPTYGMNFGGAGLGQIGGAGGYGTPDMTPFMGGAAMGYGGMPGAPPTGNFGGNPAAPGATAAAGPAAGQDFPGSGSPQGMPWWTFNQPSTGSMPAMPQAPLQEGMQLQLTPQYQQQQQQNQQKRMMLMARQGMNMMQGSGWGGVPAPQRQQQTPGYGGQMNPQGSGGFY